jgi:hypothetical protein
MKKRLSVSLAISVLLVLFWTGYVIYRDTNALEINKIYISHPRLRKLAGIKIGLLSDLHLNKISLAEDRISKAINKEKPDLILLAGDYIKYNGSYDASLQFFKRLHAPLGIYAVFGNTDYTNYNGICALRHNEDLNSEKSASLIFLINKKIRLTWNSEPFCIIGLDDPVSKRRKHESYEGIITAAGNIDSSLPTVILVHSPEVFPFLPSTMDLVFCGHNHGGQILFLARVREFIFKEPSLSYLSGIFVRDNTLMYVSKGIGTSFLPFRMFSRPEITIFEIRPCERDGWNWKKECETQYAEYNLSLLIETFSGCPKGIQN